MIKSRHAPTAFDGEGAAAFPGRWNPRGFRMVYTAQSLSLAALEILVHLPSAEALRDYVSFQADFQTRDVETLDMNTLPPAWHRSPSPVDLRNLGRSWSDRGRKPVWKVPSAVIRGEWNYLLNPLHPRFGEITVHPAGEFMFDGRLGK